MSGFKNILVPISDAATAVPQLEAAFRLAGEFAAHVVGLHVRVDPAMAVPLVGEGMSGAMVEEMMSAAEKQAATRADAAGKAFDGVCGRLGVPRAAAPGGTGLTAEWVDVTGREEEVVAWRGRLADLVVLSRPGVDAETPSPMTLNAALMESGRPLLLVPATGGGAIGRNVAIAWNGSAEAARAVACALPLLERAGAVTILSVAEEGTAAGAPADELAAYLAWHGIESRSRNLGRSGQAGEALIAGSIECGADLLVMGAYTHSRLRQLILGGVTRHVLSHAPLPCLLSH